MKTTWMTVVNCSQNSEKFCSCSAACAFSELVYETTFRLPANLIGSPSSRVSMESSSCMYTVCGRLSMLFVQWRLQDIPKRFSAVQSLL